MIMAGGFVLGETMALPAVEYKMTSLILVTLAAIYLTYQHQSRWLILLFAFCVLGNYRYSQESQTAAFLQQEKDATVEGTITQITIKSDYTEVVLRRLQFDGEACEESKAGVLVRFLEPSFADQVTIGTMKMGMKIRCNGQLKQFETARNPGEFNARNYYQVERIFYQMNGANPVIIDAHYRFGQQLIVSIRDEFENCLKGIAAAEDYGLLASILFGDKAALDKATKLLYQQNGIAHILAISGQHISFLGVGLHRLLRKIGFGYWSAGSVAIILMCAYCILTGSSPSVVRAVVMFVCMIIAGCLGRTYDVFSALSAAALGMLWNQPGLLFQAGFQLSFGAVISIAGISSWLNQQLNLPSRWQQVLVVSSVFHIITYPLILYHFYQYPIYSSMINLFVIPLTGYLMISGMLAMLLGWCSLDWGSTAIAPAHYILLFYHQLCDLFGQLPVANLILGRPRDWQIGFYYILVIFLLFWVQKKKIPSKQVIVGLIVCLVVSFFLLWPLPRSGMQIVVLDVGQGDGIFIQTEAGTVLVDGGSSSMRDLGERRLVPFLTYRGVSQIDYAIVSHGDQDHISGIQYLLAEYPQIRIKNLLLPFHGSADPACQNLAELMEKRGESVWWLRAGDEITLGQLSLTCLYPSEDDLVVERNDHSTVLLASYGAFQMLLTGDMGTASEQTLLAQAQWSDLLSQVDLLKVAHHGSKFSTSSEWIAHIKPLWAVVSYGQKNSYGHPHLETIQRLQEHQIKLWETARSGAIFCFTDGTGIRWDSYLPAEAE